MSRGAALTAALIVTQLGLSGCAWLEARGEDAADVWTIGVERQVLGVHPLVGPVGGVGLFVAPHGTAGMPSGWGLADGALGRYEHRGGTIIPPIAFLHARRREGEDPRRKDFHVVGNTLWIEGQDDPRSYFGGFEGADDWRHVAPRWGAVELAVALWYGARVGINGVELADAILGWVGLDILDDDLDDDDDADLAAEDAVPAPAATGP